MFWILYVFFWVFPRRLIFVRRRFGTLYLFHLHRLDMKYTSYPAYEDRTDRVFRNVGVQKSDAREIPKRIHTSHFYSSTISQSYVMVLYFRVLRMEWYLTIFILAICTNIDYIRQTHRHMNTSYARAILSLQNSKVEWSYKCTGFRLILIFLRADASSIVLVLISL